MITLEPMPYLGRPPFARSNRTAESIRRMKSINNLRAVRCHHSGCGPSTNKLKSIQAVMSATPGIIEEGAVR